MSDNAAMRASCRRLMARLEGQPAWPELRAIYLDLAPLIGELQAAVTEAARSLAESDGARQAQDALDLLKASSRQVGLDIRLASEPALRVGLQIALQHALDTLDALDRLEA